MVRLADPRGELPVKNHKYIKNCTELYLAQRGIGKLANFDAFVNLEVLWVNDNEIETLDGLGQCFRIKQLYAHNNRIRTLDGSSLTHFKFLEELRLHGNKLRDLQSTLYILGRLHHLHDLDLFGNPVAEEEGYRYQVIAAIPSLRVLDRHVVTDDDRAKAAMVSRRNRIKDHPQAARQQPSKSKGQRPVSVPGAPSQQMSGTVKILMKEVAAAKREQQQKAIEEAQRELQELESIRQQSFTAFSSTRAAGTDSKNRACPIPVLDEWETAALKKFFLSTESAKNGGASNGSMSQLTRYLRTRGFNLLDERGRRLNLDESAISDACNWESLLQLFASKRVRCEIMAPDELQRESSACFDKCRTLQRRMQAQQTDNDSAAELIKEIQHTSQQGYRLQALADMHPSRTCELPPASTGPNSVAIPAHSVFRTRFCFTTFAKESLSPSSSASDLQANRKDNTFLDIKADAANIDEALCQKYGLRGKDFVKYLKKQSQPSTVLVRHKIEL